MAFPTTWIYRVRASTVFLGEIESDTWLWPICFYTRRAIWLKSLYSLPYQISSLDFSNSSSKVESQKNVFADNSWQNGSMIDALGKVYDSWFMTPNHTLMLVIDVGTWKSLIAVMIFLSGLYSSWVISKPAKLTSYCVNWNLSLLKTTPLSALSFK